MYRFTPPPPPPPTPPPPHFYCFFFTTTTAFLFLFTTTTTFLFFPPNHCIKDFKLPQLVQFVSMSQVVKNNRGFLQLIAVSPAHQRHFVLRTATPQQLHGLVQVLCNVRKVHILMPEEKKRNVFTYKDALVNVGETNVPYKTKK